MIAYVNAPVYYTGTRKTGETARLRCGSVPFGHRPQDLIKMIILIRRAKETTKHQDVRSLDGWEQIV